MAEVQIEKDSLTVAKKAAELACQELNIAIKMTGQVTWVLSGGSAPMQAYEIMAKEYKDKIDWKNVWVLLGDERCVRLNDPNSNWVQISNVLLDKVPIPENQKLRPHYELDAEEAASRYVDIINVLPKNEIGEPRLDHVWIGLGEDGHTLSLFPGQTALDSKTTVVAVHNSPKPPADRISLTLNALKNVGSCMILATGSGKSEIVPRVFNEDNAFPVNKVIQVIESSGGMVGWLLDKDAAAKL